MHWLLESNLFQEHEWDQLVNALKQRDLPYTVHKVIPFIGELLPQAELQHPKVICMGSSSMRLMAAREGWTPGVYDLYDQDFLKQMDAWGDRMLNSDAQTLPFRDVVLTDWTFLRPATDDKPFAGRMFSPEEFHAWQPRVIDLGLDQSDGLNPDTLIQLCAPKNIGAEYRYWIVGGEIITSSRYKANGRVRYVHGAPAAMDDFVRQAVADWQPHRAFVIDVCETQDGPRIVEINTLNSAGFYAGDMARVVDALEALEAG